MTDTPKKNTRIVMARRTLAMGTIAMTALGATAASGGTFDAGAPEWIKLAQAHGEAGSGEGEGEAAAPAGEGEGEGAAAPAGEGEGEGAASMGGEGEGEGEAGGAGDPCASASAGGEGEGEGGGHAGMAGGEGEGEGQSAGSGGEGEGEGQAAPSGGEGEGEGQAASSGGEGEGAAAPTSGEGEGEGQVAAGGEGEGEGEGEGGATAANAEACLSRDLGFMEGHLRAGMALYEEGDLDAAKTHMGHPIQEKYDAVAAPLEESGYGRLKEKLVALSEAAEAEAPMEEIQSLYDTVYGTIEEARDEVPVPAQLMGLAMLTRIAADEYTVAVEGGEVSNLHEYQDSWGFLRVVEEEAGQLAESDDAAVAEAAATIVEQVGETGKAYGDIQGSGDFELDPSILYGAASRMELAAMGVK